MLLCPFSALHSPPINRKTFSAVRKYTKVKTRYRSPRRTELVFSLNNGQLLEWSTNGGDINSSCPECAYAEAAQMATEEEAAADFDYQVIHRFGWFFSKRLNHSRCTIRKSMGKYTTVFCGVSEWQIVVHIWMSGVHIFNIHGVLMVYSCTRIVYKTDECRLS
jgi:hypothetical protein